jgi:SAM-dependent methyltransferase
MTKDIVRENLDSYLGTEARKEWTADADLYPVEQAIIERHFPPAPANILDIGCGAGRTTIGLESRGYNVEAIDLSADLTDEAQKRVRKSRVQLMDARRLDFPSQSFDAVLFSFNGFDCLHPAIERAPVLEHVLRVLRPGGLFYYSGHNGVGAWAPRPGDTLPKVLKRNKGLLLAQRRQFKERGRYLVYPDPHGGQVLYSALPHVHLRELRDAGFAPLAVYGSRNYRSGPHYLENGTIVEGWTAALAAHVARLSLSCPHLHYVARKVAG